MSFYRSIYKKADRIHPVLRLRDEMQVVEHFEHGS